MLTTKHNLLRLITKEYGDMQPEMIRYYANLNELDFIQLIETRLNWKIEAIGSRRYLIN